MLKLPQFMERAGVRVRTGSRVTAVTPEGVALVAGGDTEVVAADTVVLALGRSAASGELADGLRAAGVDVHIIGSAARPGRVYDAIHTAFFTARLI
ncbi:hypothetical protein ACIG56_23225 [Nocardia fusca]|uniref:hypothetical protein n=1 Tax=Nocardia fusca TaxID=941183 RepID=UPI0037C579DC